MEELFFIMDLEATCWEESRPGDMETIEIGAVMLEDGGFPRVEFNEFIRPLAYPILSEFCKDLTSIRQKDVDRADPFPVVFQRFLEWLGPGPFVWCSWGNYDRKQLQQDCRRHNIEWPESLSLHINLKEVFARHMNRKQCGMKRALKMLGLPLDGTHHRGIDDARNITRITWSILPQLEEAAGRFESEKG
jgi:3'-5' exoribonuclease 1